MRIHSGCGQGMAVVLSGYNRDARLTGNTFYLLGGSAVVLWGYETNGDGTDGNQPRRTTVSENFCHGQQNSKSTPPPPSSQPELFELSIRNHS